MKRILLLSTIVFTQTILASTLTIYNSNIALVSEDRDIELKKGENNIEYDGVASSLIKESVSTDFPDTVVVHSQSYTNKPLSLYSLAQSYLGKKVGYKSLDVTLLSLSGESAIIQKPNGKISSVKASDIVFDTIPKNLTLTPTIHYRVRATKALKRRVELNYLTRNINFSTDYTLNISNTKAKLSAWANINNNSGKDFKESEIVLVAGDLNRVSTAQPMMYRSAKVSANSSQITPQSSNGYHIYKIAQKVDLYNNQNERIPLFKAKNIKLQSEYLARGNNPLYLFGERSSSITRFVKIQNLNTLLPSGTVRIYSQENPNRRKTMFLGESKISNTPKGAPLKIKVGEDFDTKVKQKVLSRADTKKSLSATIKYELSNYSQEPKKITLEVPFTKNVNASITSSLEYRFTKGNLVTFSLTLAPNATKSFEVTYTSKR